MKMLTRQTSFQKMGHEFDFDQYTKKIRKLIKKGKGKKALKLVKQLEKDGWSGSVLGDLKKQAKEA